MRLGASLLGSNFVTVSTFASLERGGRRKGGFSGLRPPRAPPTPRPWVGFGRRRGLSDKHHGLN